MIRLLDKAGIKNQIHAKIDNPNNGYLDDPINDPLIQP
jgi:hypothetical protein